MIMLLYLLPSSSSLERIHPELIMRIWFLLKLTKVSADMPLHVLFIGGRQCLLLEGLMFYFLSI